MARPGAARLYVTWSVKGTWTEARASHTGARPRPARLRSQRCQPTSSSRHPARITANLGSMEGPRNRQTQSLLPSGAGVGGSVMAPIVQKTVF